MPKVNIETIKWLMLENGFSINDLSKKTELSTGTLSKLLNDKSTPRPLTISRIAKTFNINPKQLYFQD